MLLQKTNPDNDDWIQTTFTISKCKYCGRPYIKTHHSTKYCNDKCRHYAHIEQQAEHMRNKRRQQRNGTLTNNTKILGTTRIGCTRQKNFTKEYQTIHRELQRINI